ncbi:Gfo/Idh/MocA family oxidoreductase [Paenibacillus sp. VCA1]|uniref:Gfo/Idh/MocA family protein n=1 Tax=Paenibacillus sp. VCA1 TaxID=3039148 RepID=UPI0028712F78|nr:Gfo/Idh/MocA family oxidoreductase [Paenibacillus sp. VCA1]MDR9853972.1 Gfo/Idh/MocA family oxidoreductase [Paenibacillus sp. VCA1]
MIRIGVVGAGIIAAEHLKHIHQHEGAELAAVCDVAPAAAERAVRQYGGKAYTDFDDMLDREKLDALFLCVPPFAHGDMEEKAAERGIHLLVEKPLGLEMAVVQKKAEALEKSGVITGSGYCMRYMDSVQRAKSYLQGKEIAMVRAYRFGGLPPNPWWVDHAKSGGQLVEQTTHNVDLMLYLAGDVRKVSADMALLLSSEVPGITTPDAASVNMVFASGALGHIDTGFFPQPDGRASLEILGRGFRLTLEGGDLTITEPDRTQIIRGGGDFYRAQDDAFIQAVAIGDRSLVLAPYSEALKTLAVTLAANESAKTGQAVML